MTRNGAGGSKNSSGPPDLDELMRNFNQKIGSLFGRKGGGDNRPPGGPAFARFGGGAGILIALVCAGVAGERLLHRRRKAARHGAALRQVRRRNAAGPRWHLPFPIESAEIVNVSQVRTSKSATATASRARCPKESLMLTDDENIIDLQFAVQYIVKNPQRFLFFNTRARRQRAAGGRNRDPRDRRQEHAWTRPLRRPREDRQARKS